jgi:hypothetical protein
MELTSKASYIRDIGSILGDIYSRTSYNQCTDGILASQL